LLGGGRKEGKKAEKQSPVHYLDTENSKVYGRTDWDSELWLLIKSGGRPDPKLVKHSWENTFDRLRDRFRPAPVRD
jgi:hypothetical protein